MTFLISAMSVLPPVPLRAVSKQLCEAELTSRVSPSQSFLAPNTGHKVFRTITNSIRAWWRKLILYLFSWLQYWLTCSWQWFVCSLICSMPHSMSCCISNLSVWKAGFGFCSLLCCVSFVHWFWESSGIWAQHCSHPYTLGTISWKQ